MSIAKLNQFFSKHGRFAVILLILLMVVPLVFLYGVEGCRDVVGGQAGAVAKIDGKPVTRVEFEREQRVVAFSSGGRLRRDRELAEAVIDRIMMKRKAAELGVDLVSEEQLKAEIKSVPSFQTDGEFDAKKYKEFLENNLRPRGFTAGFFEAVMHDDIVIDRVRRRLTGAVTVSELESFVNFQHSGIRYKGQAARYPSSKYRVDVKVTGEDVAAFYKENEDDYRIDQQVQVKVARFSSAEFEAELAAASEEDLKKVYEEQYSKQFEVSHVIKRQKTAANRQTLEGVIAELKKGADFAELAKKHSDDANVAESGGSLGWLSRGRMPKSFEDAAFALQEGEVAAEIVETAQGYHVVKRGGERDNPLTFDVMRDKISTTYRAEMDEAQARESWLADARYAKPQVKGSQILLAVALVDSNEYRAKQEAKAESLAAQAKKDASGFAKLATANSDDAATKTKGGDLGWFGKGGKEEAVETALFEMAVGDVRLVEGTKGFYVLKKTGERERTPFASVRTQLMSQIKNERTQQARAMAEEQAKAFIAAFESAWNKEDPEADPAVAFVATAEAAEREVFESGWLSELDTRVDGVPGSTFSLARQAVTLTAEEPLTEPVRAINDFYVAVLAGTKEGFLPEPLEDVPNPAAKEGEAPKQRLSAAGRRARNDLISKRSTEKAMEAAKADREKVAKALADGKPFKEASEGVDFQETNEFNPQFGPSGANAQEIGAASREMSAGELSDAIEVTNGAVLFYLEETKLPTMDEFQARAASFASFFQRRREMEALQSAFEKMRKEANIQYGGALSFMNEAEEEPSTDPLGSNAG